MFLVTVSNLSEIFNTVKQDGKKKKTINGRSIYFWCHFSLVLIYIIVCTLCLLTFVLLSILMCFIQIVFIFIDVLLAIIIVNV